MILGIGLDIVDTARLGRLLSDHHQRFEELAFTPGERAACAGRVDRIDALAARFAAKEACFKALGTGWSQGVSFLQVEVHNVEGGAPRLRLNGRAEERARERGVKQVHVTLTHSGGFAAATVILEG